MKKEIVNYLLECGIKPHMKGFNYLHKAIEMTIENGGIMPKITKVIYPEIAKEFNDTYSKVERAIRHSISTAKKEYRHMTSSEFIAKASIVISIVGNK